MIHLKTPAQIKLLRQGGRFNANILAKLAELAKPGVSTKYLDQQARELLSSVQAKPAFLGYRPSGASQAYPGAICLSLNEEVVHGLPSERLLCAGDLLSLDLGVEYQELISDAAISLVVGENKNPLAKKLIEATDTALREAIKLCRPGVALGDIGHLIQQTINQFGFNIFRDLAGHGVGFKVHEDPFVPNWGFPGKGERLAPGLVLAIEPMATCGAGRIKIKSDGYTIVSADGALAAHSEHTIAITSGACQVLTTG